MKKKLFRCLLVVILINSNSIIVQSFTPQGTNLTGNSCFIGDIAVININVACGAAMSFAGDLCAKPVRKFTRITKSNTNNKFN